MSLQADIDSLHSKCNELRQSFGHPTTLESEARALVKDGGSRPGTEQALLQLRDSKASELQLLSLRCCGRSTRDCHGAVTGPSGSRFNLKLLLAVADCMSTQGKELAEHTKRHEALQRENRALRELTGQHSAAEGGSAAFPASPVPSAAALVRPSSAMAAVRRQPPPVPCDGRPSPREAFAELFGSSSSSVSASVSGNVSGSGSGSGSSGIGSNQPSGVSRKPPPQPAPPAVSLKNAPPALALQRPPPPSTAAVRQPDAPSHRAPPALRRDASGLSLTAAAAALTAEVSARASSNGSRELRLLSLQRRLDESLAENAMWKRQFAKRLDERLAEMTGAAGGAPASNTAPAPAPTAPTANAPNTAPPIKPPPAAAPGPAPPSAPAPKAHIQPLQPLQPSKGAQDGAAAAVASATAADALAASAAEAERLRTELQAALVRARAAETGRDAEKQRSAKLDAELKEAHASLEKAKAALASYASADASAKQRSAGEADASKAAASKAQGAAAQAESRAQQLEQRAEKAASQQAAMHAEQAAAAAKAKAELSADLSATRESLATAERELSETRRAAERAEVRASKAEREAERVAVEARRVRDEALASAQAQASDDL